MPMERIGRRAKRGFDIKRIIETQGVSKNLTSKQSTNFVTSASNDLNS